MKGTKYKLTFTQKYNKLTRKQKLAFRDLLHIISEKNGSLPKGTVKDRSLNCYKTPLTGNLSVYWKNYRNYIEVLNII